LLSKRLAVRSAASVALAPSVAINIFIVVLLSLLGSHHFIF
jgi:hypothetical protein